MHVVIGKGNLGVDIQIALKNRGIDSQMKSAGQGFKWPEGAKDLLLMKPKCIWVTAGKGSVESAEDPFRIYDSISTHTAMPVSIALLLPKDIRLVVFSSDYAADEGDPSATAKVNPRPRSLYACTKIWMEQALTTLKRPNTCVVRVGTLYGEHFQDRRFPGKLKANYPQPGEVLLPQNLVTPTPTRWAAKMMVDNMAKLFSEQGTLVHHLAPIGNVPVGMWGRKILGPGYNILSKGFDSNRPHFSNLGCSIAKPNATWEQLWEQYLQAQSVAGR